MALRLIGLTRRYGDRLALDAVSLHVREGDCYGFLGHNGAGKTTTMRVALGLERPDAGRVIVDGFDAAEFPREARARMGGLVETPGFHGHLDGAANLATLARLQGFDRFGARAEAARLVLAVGLVDVAGKPVRAYSQGMRQRLGIAQALIGAPRIVLLDEPMSGLDPEGIEEIRRLLSRLTREEGRTVLLSSHQLGEIAGLCNRIGILRQGRMLVEEETARLLASETGRYELATSDDAEAARVLAAAGVATSPRATGGLDVSLGARAPEDVPRELVARGVGLRTWAPRPPSLEEIYLRFTQGRETERPAGVVAAEGVERRDPKERLAPTRPVGRVFGYEMRRLFSSAVAPTLFALPPIVAVFEVWRSHVRSAADVADVAAGKLATTSSVTAFEAFGSSLEDALLLLAAVLAGLASQSVAAETSHGTLRNVLLRPVRRLDVATGKSLALLAAGLVSFVVLCVAASAAASRWFEWKDVTEILPNGRAMALPGGEAAKMWPELARTLVSALPPLAAFACVGFLAGAVVRTGAAGLALAFGGAAVLVVSRAADPSLLRRFVDATRIMSNAHEPDVAAHVVAPLACAVVAFVAAAFVLQRKAIR